MFFTTLMSALAVVGGAEVNGEYPSVVLMHTGSQICSATILHERWVMTAAHCWDEVDLTQYPAPPFATVLEADKMPDDYNSAIPMSPDPRGVQLDEVFVHPGYESFGFSPNSVAIRTDHSINDVALVRVAAPLTGPALAVNDTPIDSDWIGIEPRFVGYGITSFGGTGAGTKRMVDLPISAADGDLIETYRPGASLCQGDPGSPGLLEIDTQLVQLSLASFGRNCDRSNHTRVAANIDWLQEMMGDELLTIVSIPAPSPSAPDPVSIQPASGCASAPGPLGGLSVALGGLLLVARRR